MPSRTWAEKLADFASSLAYDDLPTRTIEQAKLHFLNIIGLCLASSRLEGAAVAVKVARELGGRKESSILGTSYKVGAASAALANGTAAHVLDFDDTHNESFVHIGSTVIPTALAMGEKLQADGKKLIASAVAGMESGIRIGIAAPGLFTKRGFHSTSICGTFASAVVSSRLMGVTSRVMADCLGICGSMASGIHEHFADGSWVKQVHPGWASHAGIIASLLAKNGMTGPHSVLEGRFGLYRTHLDEEEVDLDRIGSGLGKNWESASVSFKPYPCGVVIHSFLDCAAKLRRENGIEARDVASVVCTVPEGMVPLVCEPRERKMTPRTPYDAKFSLQFAVSAMLTLGTGGLAAFSEESLHNKMLLDLAKRVEYVVDPTIDYPRTMPARITIVTRSGSSITADFKTNRGGPDLPMTRQEHMEKFKELCGGVLERHKVNEITATVLDLENLGNARDLTDLCVPSSARRL